MTRLTACSLTSAATFVLALAGVAIAPASAQTAAMLPEEPGIYLERADGAPVVIDAAITRDVQTKGALKAMFTQGLSKPKQVARHAGASAAVATGVTRPSFVVRFPPRPPSASVDPLAAAQQALAGGSLAMMAGRDPTVLALRQMKVDGDARVLESGQRSLKFEHQTLAPDVYRLTPGRALAPGEYAFIIDDDMFGGPAQVWAFSVPGS